MTNPSQHWAAVYIGRAWSPADNCLDFARRVWREQMGWDVPVLAADIADPRAVRRAFEAGSKAVSSGALNGGVNELWTRVDAPVEFDAVLMSRGQRACHIGVWAAPEAAEPGILHSIETAGVIFTPPGRLPGLGLAVMGYWRFACARLS